MEIKKFKKPRTLTVREQREDMAQKHPEFTPTILGNEISWVGPLRPLDATAIYTVKIDALIGQRPWVSVIEPELQIPREKWGETHRFFNGTLCLHLHEEWQASLHISETIIPWTLLWLVSYEYWLATDKWKFKGKHADIQNEKELTTNRKKNVQDPYHRWRRH